MGDAQQKHAARFLKMMLNWDYGSLWTKYRAGEGVVDQLPQMPTTFKDIKEYKCIFEMMIMEEALAQIMQGSESADLITPQPSVAISAAQNGDFLEVRMVLSEEHAAKFNHMDLVVVDTTNPFAEDNEHAFETHAIGQCDGRDGGCLRMKFYLSPEALAGDVAGQERVARMRKRLLTPMSCWWIMRLANTATICREWAAVQRVELSPLQDVILTAEPRTAAPTIHLEVPPVLMQHLEATYNASQLAALSAGLDGKPVVLIQGPPGTGKTKTILGLLSVLKNSVRKGTNAMMAGSKGVLQAADEMNEKLALWHRAAPWLVAKPHNTSIRDMCGPTRCLEGSPENAYGLKPSHPAIQLGEAKLTKARILVCAPSNSALDEIVLRVLRDGLLNAMGAPMSPSIVRVGVTARMHHSVLPVSLEHATKQRLPASDGPGQRMEIEAAQASLLNNADIVFSTLAFSGGAVFKRVTVPFDTVVIDEAAQALEPSCLVPLLTGVKQVYMVGDPIQLPATVISSRAVAANYQQSLFKRLQDSGYPVHVLGVQYRMNPAISCFASETFYGGKIEDGPNVEAGTAQPYHRYPCLGPLAFFHVDGQEGTPEGSASICNHEEADMVVALIERLVTEHPELGAKPLIGVISPYKSQVKLLREKIDALLTRCAPNIDINTIDGFQGREKDVVLFTTVRSRSSKTSNIGFVADERRINVGLTRARCSLLVVGHRWALRRNAAWGSLIQLASDRGVLYDCVPKFKTFLQKIVDGKAKPVKVAKKEPVNDVFFAGAEDDNVDALKVPSKRSAGGKLPPSKRVR